jgi:hypothetical protein
MLSATSAAARRARVKTQAPLAVALPAAQTLQASSSNDDDDNTTAAHP